MNMSIQVMGPAQQGTQTASRNQIFGEANAVVADGNGKPIGLVVKGFHLDETGPCVFDRVIERLLYDAEYLQNILLRQRREIIHIEQPFQCKP